MFARQQIVLFSIHFLIQFYKFNAIIKRIIIPALDTYVKKLKLPKWLEIISLRPDRSDLSTGEWPQLLGMSSFAFCSDPCYLVANYSNNAIEVSSTFIFFIYFQYSFRYPASLWFLLNTEDLSKHDLHFVAILVFQLFTERNDTKVHYL